MRSALLLSVCSLVVLLSLSPLASAQAVATFSPTSLNFGSVELGTSSAPQQLTLTNTGNATLIITKIKPTGANATDFTFPPNPCGTQLLAGANCIISVTFTPTKGGNRSGNVNAVDSAANSPQNIPLAGVGLAPLANLVPQSLVFGAQAIGSPSAPQNITLKNTGQASLAISSITMVGTNPSEFAVTNNCGTSLAINATCTITAVFTPAGPWSRTAGIFLNDNALGSPQVMGLMGNGTSGGLAGFSPSSITFPTRLMGTTSPATPVTLSNTGTAPLQILTISAGGDYAQTNNCGTSVDVGASCVINVTFTPSLNATRPGWINVNFTDPAGIQTVALIGGGALPNPIAVKPRASSITKAQTQQYTAFLSSVQTTAVTWYVDAVIGGNATAGTISTTGLYTPPTTGGGTHIVTAANNANLNQKASAPVVVSSYTGTLTHHNDALRTGQNNNEPALTTGNVNKVQFGKLFTQPVDGQIYSEPLWVPNLSINGLHNVVFVCTQHDSVYAFDADTLGAPLWHASFIDPANGITSIPRADIEVGLDISPEIGITSTPVIDLAHGILFVEARTKEVTGTVTSYVHKLHALSIKTGLDMPGSPIAINASLPGIGYDNVGGVVSFNSMRENNRAGLLLLNGTVYIAFASLEDINPYHGWILGYNYDSVAGTLTQSVVFNDTVNSFRGGIWHGGGGLPADASGNIYATTGTGGFDATVGGGISFLKMTRSGTTLNIVDFFSPFNQAYLNLEAINADISASGPMLLPDQAGSVPHLALFCGKTGTIYLANRENLGKFTATDSGIVQALFTTIGTTTVPSGNWGTPAFFNGQIFIEGIKDTLKQYGVAAAPGLGGPAILSGGPMAVGADIVGYPGSTPVISSNGLLNGIVWIVQSDGAASGKASTLRAYDANNVTHELYNTGLNGTKDTAGPAVKFATPTVANGKVYVPTASELDVYGLQP